MKTIFIIIFCAGVIQSGYTSTANPDTTAEWYYLYDNGPPPTPVWYFSIFTGSGFILGDVRPAFISPANKPAFSLGLSVQRNYWGQGWQLYAGYAQAYGLDKAPGAFQNNVALNGTAISFDQTDFIFPDYTGKTWIPNYSSKIISGSIDYVLGNQDPWQLNYFDLFQLYLSGGPGFIAYKTKYDAYNNTGGIYDFDALVSSSSSKLKDIRNLLDGEYETPGELKGNPTAYAANGKFTFHTSLNIGLAISYFVTKNFYFGLQQRVSYYFNDLADGQQWNINGNKSGNNDWLFTTDITFGYLKSNDSIIDPFAYWDLISPGWEDYDPDKLLRDSDNDGVINMKDKDPTTSPFTPVDTDGIVIDSDHDGCTDDVDPEPMSDLRRKMIGCENEIISADSMRKYLLSICEDCFVPQQDVPKSNNWYLPMIFFNPGSYSILDESIDALNMIVKLDSIFIMPIEVMGSAASNETTMDSLQLVYLRARSAIQYLLDNGVAPELISWISKANNSSNPIIRDGYDPEFYMNRKVSFYTSGIPPKRNR